MHAVLSYERNPPMLKQYIFVEKEAGKFEMTEVVTGATENGFIEITSMKKNDSARVVFKGAYTLLMALKNKSQE